MAQARTEAHRLASYARLFWRRHGRWPDLAALTAMQVIDGDALPGVDPWGRGYRVESVDDGAACVVRSAGRDGAAGSCDDVVSQPFAHGGERESRGDG